MRLTGHKALRPGTRRSARGIRRYALPAFLFIYIYTSYWHRRMGLGLLRCCGCHLLPAVRFINGHIAY